MRGLFRNMDLYKGIVLACVVLLPVAGGWTYWLRGQIGQGIASLRKATKNGGLLEEIGALQKQMESLVTNRSVAGQAQYYTEYFNTWVYGSARDGQIKSDDFTLAVKETKGGSGTKQRFKDVEVTISFARRGTGDSRLALSRAYIFAMLYNCEMKSPVWKLRQLKIRNATDEKDLTARKTPPLRLEDNWYVMDLKFARREPEK